MPGEICEMKLVVQIITVHPLVKESKSVTIDITDINGN